MADVSFSASLQISKDNLAGTFARSSTTDIATAGMLVHTLTLGTTPTQISTATIGSLGMAFGQSLVSVTQATATVSIGRLVGGVMHESAVMRPGEAFAMRLAPGDYAAKGAAAGYRIQVVILEE